MQISVFLQSKLQYINANYTSMMHFPLQPLPALVQIHFLF